MQTGTCKPVHAEVRVDDVPENRSRGVTFNGSAGRMVLLGLGANVAGRWGTPAESVQRAVGALQEAGLRVVACSSLCRSAPVGRVRQPDFVNAVILVESALPPLRLLGLLKSLERACGRRPGVRWGPRPLDIDILASAGRRCNSAARATSPGRIVLPHPELHRRAFVLAPLAEIAPRWRHPVLGKSADALLRELPAASRSLCRHAGQLPDRTR